MELVKGDDFFNLIEHSSEKFAFGITELPRDEKTVKQSMASGVIENPAFSIFSDEPRFKRLVKRLGNSLKDVNRG